jgi:hypothetical protein
MRCTATAKKEGAARSFPSLLCWTRASKEIFSTSFGLDDVRERATSCESRFYGSNVLQSDYFNTLARLDYTNKYVVDMRLDNNSRHKCGEWACQDRYHTRS